MKLRNDKTTMLEVQYFEKSTLKVRVSPQNGTSVAKNHSKTVRTRQIVYASKKFEKAHKDYPLTRSMSRAATPTDNPVIESLKGWIKAELKHDLKIHDFTDINTAIELYINYFNNNRPAWKLDYLTPVEYRTINGFKFI